MQRNEVFMNGILYATIMIGLWLVNLFNGTGLGNAFQTTEKFRIIVFVSCLLFFLINIKKGYFFIKKKDFLVFSCMSLIFVLISYFRGYESSGINFLSVFALVYLLSKMKVKDKTIKLVGYAYIILGITILYIYDYGTFLSGWNPNTIGMIGLYSYLIFMIPYYNNKKNTLTIFFLVIVTLLYMFLIQPTDSRSSILFAFVAILFALSIIPKNIIVNRGNNYFWLLLIPLFIAIIVVLISKGSYMQSLDLWSMEKFHKPIFNGRDILWENGFRIFLQNFIFGSGSLAGNWHNCMIGILVAYGIVGGLMWISALNIIIKKSDNWLNDNIVSGSIIAFFIIYFQQTVELGLVHESPNLLPYIVLGIMLSRINYLEKKYY